MGARFGMGSYTCSHTGLGAHSEILIRRSEMGMGIHISSKFLGEVQLFVKANKQLHRSLRFCSVFHIIKGWCLAEAGVVEREHVMYIDVRELIIL